MFGRAFFRLPMVMHSAIVGILAAVVWAGGCVGSAGQNPSGGDEAVVDGNVNPDPALIDGKHISGEPDDTFAQAIDVILAADDSGNIQGTISPGGDIDIFNLGPMSPGDAILVDLQGGAGLSANIAIFDANERLFIENAGRASNDPNPLVSEVVRHAGGNYYLAVAASGLVLPWQQSGTYTAVIAIARGGAVPPPTPQAVLLSFAGGTIIIPDVWTYTAPPFDAGDIDPAYAGQTAAIKQHIIQTVEDSYRGFGLEVYDTDFRPAPAGVPVSRVLFGRTNSFALGIAQMVDAYNHDPTDSSIVFIDDFAPTLFGRLLTPEEVGKAIGNVTAHEIGHLVGLSHVNEPTDIMSTAGGRFRVIDTLTFQESPLDPLVFPMGAQDEPLLLGEILGPG
jgi:hypothetical protein